MRIEKRKVVGKARLTHKSTIRPALTILGVSRNISHAVRLKHDSNGYRSFWRRHARDLDGVLKDIQAAWRRSVKAAHVDRGGSHEQFVAVNLAWEKVKRLFARRGVTLH